MNTNNLRKEKEREFYMEHMDTFKAIGLADPFFTIKTAFFKKGKFGKQCQFFEWELKKGDDLYMEFYENIYEDGKSANIIPALEERPLFKLKYNPFYHEEYDVTETIDADGKVDRKYLVPVSEMSAVLSSGQEISYALYEKRKEDAKLEIPQLQKSLSMFPDFEEEYSPLKTEAGSINEEIADVPLSEMTLRDLAAIMLIKPISARPWLNELIKQTKSEI
jgi:hypothetical protein